jgi:ElaB/YqjD/DUF883 family membrane-anchored ribosome-binding protein
MADQNTPNTTGSADAAVTFEPAAPIETGAAEQGVMFNADSEMTDGKKSPVQTLKDGASKVGAQATDKIRAYAGDGKERAAGGLDEFSNLMRDAARSVDEKLGDQYGQYARTAADQIQGFAETLRTKEIDELVDDARAFVRKSPGVAIGVAAGVGFVLARLVRSGVEAAGSETNRRGPEA